MYFLQTRTVLLSPSALPGAFLIEIKEKGNEYEVRY